MSASKPKPSPSQKARGTFADSRQLFYTAFHSSPTAIVLSRLSDGRFVEANESFLQLTGYTLDEVIGLTSTEAGITSDPKAREERLAALQQNKPLPTFEIEVTRKSGEVRHGLATVTVIEIEGEKFALSTFVDITERKHAEAQLVQMKRLYATLSQVNQTIVRVRSRDELFQSICDVAVQFGGFTLAWIGLLDEASGDIKPVAANGLDVDRWPFKLANIHHGDFKDGLAATAVRTSNVTTSDDVQTHGSTQRVQDQIRELDYHASAAVPFRLKGKTIGVIGLVSNERGLFKDIQEVRLLEEMGLDISFALDAMETEDERKRAEQQLRESEELFAKAFYQSPIGITLTNLEDMTVRDVNDAMLEMIGFTRDQIVGQKTLDLKLDIAPEIRAAMVRKLQEGRWFHNQEVSIGLPNGETRYLLNSGALVDIGGKPHNLGLFQDITERKRAEHAVLKSEQQMNALVSSLDDIIFEFDEQGTYLNIWAGNETLLVQPKEQLLGQRIVDALGDENGRPFNDAVKRVTSGGQSEIIEYSLDVLGGKRWFLASVSPIVAPDNSYRNASMLVRDISRRKRAEERIQNQLQRLHSLRDIDSIISSSFDLNLSLETILSTVLAELKVDATDVLVFDSVSHLLEYRAGLGFRSKDLLGDELRIGEGIIGRSITERRPIHIRDLRERAHEFIRKNLLYEEKFIGYYCIPLINKGQVKGVLEVFHRSELDPDQEWVDFLHTLAGQTAMAIENATLFDDLQRSNLELGLAHDQTIEGWSRALDLRGRETGGHTQRVTQLTFRLGLEFGLGSTELLQIRRGALLHDIGNLGVPDQILFKPGPLTDEEWAKMRQHPQFAYDLISPIHYLLPALDIPYCHHEKWDGTGYPRGLKGEQIPIAARLFAVVDVWDSLCNDRPYRARWPQEKALEYIRSQAGTHFDPKCVELFLQVMDEKMRQAR